MLCVGQGIMTPILSGKNKYQGAGDMAQQLSALAALSEDPNIQRYKW